MTTKLVCKEENYIWERWLPIFAMMAGDHDLSCGYGTDYP